MRIHWFYAGRQPDSDNIVARLKAARDGIADACLVSDDRDIQIGEVITVRVPRTQQHLLITMIRMEAA
jgi:Holliday junction resolvase RusA-like endonuclease